MTEALEQIAVLKSPLHETHARLGATMIERDGWSVPQAYGDPQLEYAAVRDGGAGLIDLSPRGRLLVSGTEAVQFLNGLITNDMKTLAVNHWMPAAFPNVQGRLIASVRVVRLQDERTDMTTPAPLPRRGPRENVCPTFLIDTEAATHDRVLKTIERFTLAGDFRVTDVTNQTALVSVQGTKAAGVVRSVFGEAATASEAGGSLQITVRTGSGSDRASAELASDGEITDEVTIIRASHTGADGFDLLVNASEAKSLWTTLQNAGARPVGYDALETLRIEAGAPRYGIDMDETNVVTETGLDEAVSYTKGCYIGQEIIARIKYRGHVAKKLCGLLFAGTVNAAAGANVKSTDGKEIGRVTSVTYSPQLQRTIALGYLKFDYLAAATEVKVIVGDEEIAAQVVELPFVRGTAPEEQNVFS